MHVQCTVGDVPWKRLAV